MSEDPAPTIEVSADWLRRRVLYDIVPYDHVPEFLSRMGLIGPSDDGFEVERASSAQRIHRTDQLDHVVEPIMKAIQEVLEVYALDERVLATLPVELHSPISRVVSVAIDQSVIATCYALLANLLDLGNIKVGEIEE